MIEFLKYKTASVIELESYNANSNNLSSLFVFLFALEIILLLISLYLAGLNSERKIGFKESKNSRTGNIDTINEICRAIWRLDSQSLPIDYRKAFFESISKHYPMETGHLSYIARQLDGRETIPPTNSNAEPQLEYKSTLTEQQKLEIDHWIQFYPQYAFTLIVGLSSNRGESFAWGLAYG